MNVMIIMSAEQDHILFVSDDDVCLKFIPMVRWLCLIRMAPRTPWEGLTPSTVLR